MRWSNYSTLKAAGKVSFAKVDEVKDSDGNEHLRLISI